MCVCVCVCVDVSGCTYTCIYIYLLSVRRSSRVVKRRDKEIDSPRSAACAAITTGAAADRIRVTDGRVRIRTETIQLK